RRCRERRPRGPGRARRSCRCARRCRSSSYRRRSRPCRCGSPDRIRRCWFPFPLSRHGEPRGEAISLGWYDADGDCFASLAMTRKGARLRYRFREAVMSVQARPKRLSVTQIQSRKGGDKIVCLTAYTAPVARLLDAEVDLLLVGDSLAMTVYGFDSTLPVTLDMMIAHGAAVVRATQHALITV